MNQFTPDRMTTDQSDGKEGVGASAEPTGCSQAEPEVSALRASPPRAAFTSGPWDSPKPTEVSAKSWAKLHCDCPMQFVTVGWDGFTGETVAIVYGDDDEQEAANAHLIASAPELYEALADLIEPARPNAYPQPDKPDSPYGRIERARLVLARARGESR